MQMRQTGVVLEEKAEPQPSCQPRKQYFACRNCSIKLIQIVALIGKCKLNHCVSIAGISSFNQALNPSQDGEGAVVQFSGLLCLKNQQSVGYRDIDDADITPLCDSSGVYATVRKVRQEWVAYFVYCQHFKKEGFRNYHKG